MDKFVDTKYVSFLSTRFVREILRPDTYVMSYGRYAAATNVGRHMQCPLFSSDFNKNWRAETNSMKLYDMKFYKNTLSGYRSNLC
jgi:hypothetical protein